jgi:hypothetical protein
VTGELAPAAGFAGAWVAFDGKARAVDASDFDGVRLKLRGAGAVGVAVRGGPMAGYNYAASVEAGAEWKPIDVPFDSLKPIGQGAPAFDRRSLRWLGVTVGAGRSGPFEFEIDDVHLYSRRSDAALRVQDGPTLASAFQASPASELPKGPWKELARDAPDDGKHKRLPDATALAVCFDGAQDRVWFRISLAGPLPRRWLGANLALDVDGDPNDGMAWWGSNRAFHFDRLVTVYGLETGGGYDGTLAIADAKEVQAGNMTGSAAARVQIVLDEARPAFVIGIPRQVLGPVTKTPLRVVAAVGSAFQHNDDVPNEGAALLDR